MAVRPDLQKNKKNTQIYLLIKIVKRDYNLFCGTSLADSDAGRCYVFRNLTGSILSILPAFMRWWEI